MVVLVACMTTRPFLGELPFRTSAVRISLAAPQQPPEASVSRNDLSRAVFPLVLFAAAALWLAGWAAGGAGVRCAWLAWPILAFAAWSCMTIFYAGDKRAATLSALEQVSLLAVAFLAAQVFASPRRWRLLLAIVLAVGIAMAAKGMYQSLVEAPERIADFAANRAERLAHLGAVPGSPQAIAFESRLKDPAPFGYFALANPFASLLLLLTAAGAGLAIARVREALASWRAQRASQGPREVHLPLLGAVLLAAATAPLVAVLALTRSRGALAAAAAVAVAGAMVAIFRRTLARHWKTSAAAAVLVLVAGVAAVAAYGMRHDGLPSKSLMVRWFYWTASAEIVRDHPLVGVGGGNFGNAYLLHRRPQAEEVVKLPHNVLMNSLAQFGLPGGLVLLAVLCGVIVLACRPAPALPSPADAPGGRRTSLLAAAAALAAMMLARWQFTEGREDEAMFIFEVLLPGCLFAAALATTLWAGGCLSRQDGAASPADAGGSRFLVACGLVAFVLHNLVEDSLAIPGAAIVFWTLVGACMGRAAGAPAARGAGAPWWARVALAAPVAVIAVAAAALSLQPVAARTFAFEAAADEFSAGRMLQASARAQQAAAVDKLDGISAIDAARFILTTCPHSWRYPHSCPGEAYQWARVAVGRNAKDSSAHQFAATAGWYAEIEDSRQLEWRQPSADPNAEAAAIRERFPDSWNDQAALARLSYLEFLRGQYLESMRLADRAATLNPDSIVLHAQLGYAAAAAGLTAQAHDAWRRAAALARAPDRAGPVLDLMARAVALNPMEARTHVEFARMQAAANRPREALDQLAAADAVNAALISFGESHPPQSSDLFTPLEQFEIDLLRKRCEFLAGGAGERLQR